MRLLNDAIALGIRSSRSAAMTCARVRIKKILLICFNILKHDLLVTRHVTISSFILTKQFLMRKLVRPVVLFLKHLVSCKFVLLSLVETATKHHAHRMMALMLEVFKWNSSYMNLSRIRLSWAAARMRALVRRRALIGWLLAFVRQEATTQALKRNHCYNKGKADQSAVYNPTNFIALFSSLRDEARLYLVEASKFLFAELRHSQEVIRRKSAFLCSQHGNRLVNDSKKMPRPHGGESNIRRESGDGGISNSSSREFLSGAFSGIRYEAGSRAGLRVGVVRVMEEFKKASAARVEKLRVRFRHQARLAAVNCNAADPASEEPTHTYWAGRGLKVPADRSNKSFIMGRRSSVWPSSSAPIRYFETDDSDDENNHGNGQGMRNKGGR